MEEKPGEYLDRSAVRTLRCRCFIETLAFLHKKYCVNCLDDLKSCLEKAATAKLKGFGQKKIDNIKRGIDLWQASQKRMLIGVALPLAENLLSELRKIKLIERAEVAGSLRRRKETIGDIDVLIISKDSSEALRQTARLPLVKQVLGIGDTKATVIIEGGIQVDIRAVVKESYAPGNRDSNRQVRKRSRSLRRIGVSGRRNLSGRSHARTGKAAVYLGKAANGSAVKCGSFLGVVPGYALRHRSSPKSRNDIACPNITCPNASGNRGALAL